MNSKTLSKSLIIKVGIAIVLIVAISVGALYIRECMVLRQMGTEKLNDINLTSSRGVGYEGDFAKIHEKIKQKSFDDAQIGIDSLRSSIQKDSDEGFYASTEEQEYYKEIVKTAQDKLDWYQTLLYMDSQKLAKARKWLRKISESDSKYSDEASVMYECLLF
ncbi:MAG: hypothetical protein MJ197_05665 [Bacteroidales bacterium]|nr:hypothetical protein [Bacteroidales bacterium]